ncbi:hypothetical protein BaRGS_00006742 [Batillaria attramentaria]|uniref:Winged helix Storkhead-box1 domain-containing protein n=1 Tax=Batillaria attramentaria TaxID=370345 RepID=A0ABD0LRT8_9CAEN
MSQRQAREERRLAARNLPVASKCLAIVLLPQKKQTTKNSEDVNGDRDRKGTTAAGSTAIPENTKTTGLIGGNSAGAPYNGKTLLEDFKQQNKTCYWNPALIESIRQLEYLGFVEPCTVLVGGEDIHLENLRSAWGRRVLKAPVNFTIDRIGDVNGIEMQVIPQTQFIPLPDSLCLIITELNNAQQAATLDSIRARLQRWYQNTTLPSHQLIYDTLGQLIRERKVFHNGEFLVVPLWFVAVFYVAAFFFVAISDLMISRILLRNGLLQNEFVRFNIVQSQSSWSFTFPLCFFNTAKQHTL